MPTTQELVCESSCAGFDTQATTTGYDALGRPTSYEDADGNKASVTYDLLGRAVTNSDNKGSETIGYDPISGLPTKLEVSGVGTFTATYDADGDQTERVLPNGLTAKTTYNEVDEPSHLTYTKSTSCGTSCTWFDEGVERSIYGQILSNSNTLSSELYSYDKADRLKLAEETPKGGSCTTRSYEYDKDSNRTSLTTRAPGLGGACDTSSAGTKQGYEYDAADRLHGTGASEVVYDPFGRITSLPAADAGGKALTTSYFSNEMVATQTQGSITNSFQLDATGRQRQRLQGGGGLEGNEIFHYDGPSDSPAWTERSGTWTRNIGGIGGELAAVQEVGKEITLQLTNLQGDVLATAAINPEATSLKSTFSYDEFGNPTSGTAGRFGWLGGKQRRTEFASGIIQMGARSYVPSIGRFISPDSIQGGSASAYDYANADPVNDSDVAGTCPLKKCRKLMAVARRAALRGLSRTRARGSTGIARSIINSIFSPNAPLSLHDCVPGEDVGIKATVWNKVMGVNCVPKLHLGSVNSAAETQADAAAGLGWCIAINTLPITSAKTGILSPLTAAAYCSNGPADRPWAYVHADGDGVPPNKSTW